MYEKLQVLIVLGLYEDMPTMQKIAFLITFEFSNSYFSQKQPKDTILNILL